LNAFTLTVAGLGVVGLLALAVNQFPWLDAKTVYGKPALVVLGITVWSGGFAPPTEKL
jgi:hypothetical protein